MFGVCLSFFLLISFVFRLHKIQPTLIGLIQIQFSPIIAFKFMNLVKPHQSFLGDMISTVGIGIFG